MNTGVYWPRAVSLPFGSFFSIGGCASNTPHCPEVLDIIQGWNHGGKKWLVRPEKLTVAKVGPMTLVPDDWCNPNKPRS